MNACEDWPLDEACTSIPAERAERTREQQSAVAAATELLSRLTAGRYGLCPERLRPCHQTLVARPRQFTGTGVGAGPYLSDGRWINVGCGCTTPGCGCSSVPEITVPGPIHVDDTHPVEVTIDGTPLAGSSVLVYPPNLLVRADGSDWPLEQRLDLAATEPGTWSIQYTRGTPVPAGGRRAAAILAAELHKACEKPGSCKLPSRVQQIVREGVSYTMLDPQDYLDQGRTGLTEVDMWIRAVNPNRLAQPASVWSPDLAKARRGPY